MATRNAKIALVVSGCVLAVGAVILTTVHYSAEQVSRPDGKASQVSDGGRRPGGGRGTAGAPAGGKTVAHDAGRRSDAGHAAFPARASDPERAGAEDLSTYERVPQPAGQGGEEGEVVEAYVSVAALNRRMRMMPNQIGEYPRIWMGDAARAEVTLVFQDAAPGTPVVLAAQDGGKFTGHDKASVLTAVDQQQKVSFAFDVSSNPGVHRVTTRTPSGDVKMLEFWAGEAPAIQTAAR